MGGMRCAWAGPNAHAFNMADGTVRCLSAHCPDCGELSDAYRANIRVLYAANEATPDDEAEEDRIIEEAQAKAARNDQAQRQWSGVVDLTLTDGVWKE